MESASTTTIAGPLILACMFSYLLYGVSVVQFTLYLVQYPNDRLLLKALVWLVFTLETVTTVVVGIIGWKTFGDGFGDWHNYVYCPKLPFVANLYAHSENMAVCYHNNYFCRWCAFSFLFGTRVIQLGLHYDSPKAVGEYIDIWITCSAVCDVVGTGAMVIILAKSHSRSIIKSTSTILWNILKFTAETGLITTIWAILHLGLWLTMPQTSFHYIFYFGLARLYSNWLFATLNSRVYITSGCAITSFRAQSPLWMDFPLNRPQDGPQTVTHFSQLLVTTEVMVDGMSQTPNKSNLTANSIC
ncbi:hypothetical protein AB1N83_006604 [Pleurotus pulmonarius]